MIYLVFEQSAQFMADEHHEIVRTCILDKSLKPTEILVMVNERIGMETFYRE